MTIKYLVLLGLAFCTVSPVRAQTTMPGRNTYWINGELGTGTYQVHVGLELGLVLQDNYRLSLKGAANGNVQYEGARREADLVALLMGKRLTQGNYFVLPLELKMHALPVSLLGFTLVQD